MTSDERENLFEQKKRKIGELLQSDGWIYKEKFYYNGIYIHPDYLLKLSVYLNGVRMSFSVYANNNEYSARLITDKYFRKSVGCSLISDPIPVVNRIKKELLSKVPACDVEYRQYLDKTQQRNTRHKGYFDELQKRYGGSFKPQIDDDGTVQSFIYPRSPYPHELYVSSDGSSSIKQMDSIPFELLLKILDCVKEYHNVNHI